jgi:UDP-glucose 4-epimerase
LRAILAEHGVTHLVHGAFVVNKASTTNADQMRSINVDGSQLVLKTAFELGLEQLLFISSVSVYGYRGGNPALVREDHRLWPNMQYAQHKTQVETYLRDLSQRYPDTRTLIVRPAAIGGPLGRTLSPLLALVAQPFFVLSNGGRARTQALHEDDAARLIGRAIEMNASGTLNAAPNDQATWAEIAALSHRTPLALPRPLLNIAARLSPLIPDLHGFTREIVDYFSESLVVDNSAAKQMLGWSPQHTTLDAFGQLFGTATMPREQRIGETR